MKMDYLINHNLSEKHIFFMGNKINSKRGKSGYHSLLHHYHGDFPNEATGMLSQRGSTSPITAQLNGLVAHPVGTKLEQYRGEIFLLSWGQRL